MIDYQEIVYPRKKKASCHRIWWYGSGTRNGRTVVFVNECCNDLLRTLIARMMG